MHYICVYEHCSTCIPQSISHTFLARILQKWYISDTICKNLARILDFIYICFADAVKIFHLEIFRLFFQFTFKIQAFSSKLLLSRFRHFLPSYFQDQAFSSKILPRSDIFFQVTSKIRHFLPSYFQDQIFSCKILQDQTFSCKILQDQTLSSKIFQDTCKNNALSSKILEVKSDRFLQEMYGSSTGVKIANKYFIQKIDYFHLKS